ncbi:Fatty acid hydroxylase [Lasallia pustulata]|uniref:Fatty acid hydroxylase n=1 Tax=Lasallia pustulata TaxID=136370 RepID=A0A1W5CXK4_9LECA|nr:Fatty acid hydroxylase [Lasallia pustulata]
MDFFRLSEPSLLDRAWQLIQAPYDIVHRAYKLMRSAVDVIFAVPALSFFVIPAFSSWSTSLNLLFFYLTWSTLVLSQPPLKVELIGTLTIRLLFYILPSLGFFLFDTAVPSLAAGIKEHGDVALPLNDKKGRWWKVALVSIGNVLLGLALQLAIAYAFTEIFHIRSALKVSTTLPMPWGIAKDLSRGLLVREVLTYTLHRHALHSPYSNLTPYHTAWQHTLPAPYSLAAHYDHPLPYLLHVFLPTYIPALLFRFHILTYYIYLVLVSVEETFAYSGYNVLPSGFVLGGIARRQESHLMDGGRGNYGCWGLCDYVGGTSIGGVVVEDVMDEAEEKDVVQKAKGRRRGAGKKRK